MTWAVTSVHLFFWKGCFLPFYSAVSPQLNNFDVWPSHCSSCPHQHTSPGLGKGAERVQQDSGSQEGTGLPQHHSMCTILGEPWEWADTGLGSQIQPTPGSVMLSCVEDPNVSFTLPPLLHSCFRVRQTAHSLFHCAVLGDRCWVTVGTVFP